MPDGLKLKDVCKVEIVETPKTVEEPTQALTDDKAISEASKND